MTKKPIGLLAVGHESRPLLAKTQVELWYLLSNPSITPRRMRLQRNTHLAAENAARLVEATIDQL